MLVVLLFLLQCRAAAPGPEAVVPALHRPAAGRPGPKDPPVHRETKVHPAGARHRDPALLPLWRLMPR